MDIVRLRIPYGFVRDRARVGWRDVRFGLENELLDPQAPIEMALRQLAETNNPSPGLVELAGADKNASTMWLVEELADAEAQPPANEISDRWLYIVLSWLYENRDKYSNALQKVEEVYADFNYPEHIANFVRYMPMDGPDLGSGETNERRLFERWKSYLDACSATYAP